MPHTVQLKGQCQKLICFTIRTCSPVETSKSTSFIQSNSIESWGLQGLHYHSKTFQLQTDPFHKSGASWVFSNIAHNKILYKTSHDAFEPVNMANVKFNETPTRKKAKAKNPTVRLEVLAVKPKVQRCSSEIPVVKKTDIVAAFSFMPLHDREFYKRNS